jgi:hypothetical protein
VATDLGEETTMVDIYINGAPHGSPPSLFDKGWEQSAQHIFQRNE